MVAEPTMVPPHISIVATVSATHRHFLAPHAMALREAGFHVTGISDQLTREPVVNSYDATIDVPIPRRLKPAAIVQSVIQLRRAFRANTDVVWVHTPIAALATRIAAASIANRPIIVYMAHGFHFRASHRRPLRQRLYFLAEWLLSPLTDVLQVVNAEDFRQAQTLPRRNLTNTIKTRGVGIDVAKFEAASRQQARTQLGWQQFEHVALIVGELNREKRVGDAIVAAGEAVGELGPIRLVVVGTGPDHLHLAAMPRRPGLTVEFLGQRDDIDTLMAGADVLLHPSEREGLPTVVLEALATGLPVIGARTRGTVDLLDQDRGELVAVGDISGYASAIGSAVSKKAQSGTARDFVHTYSVKEATKDTVELFISLLGSPVPD